MKPPPPPSADVADSHPAHVLNPEPNPRNRLHSAHLWRVSFRTRPLQHGQCAQGLGAWRMPRWMQDKYLGRFVLNQGEDPSGFALNLHAFRGWKLR